ncbi:MAG: DUF2188 domain-containing protein [Rhodanobacter sp.]
MNLIEIPFAPDASHGWTIPIPGDGEKQFSSRENALAFARTLSRDVEMQSGNRSYLCVEGADGKWRLFTADLLPVHKQG